MVRSSVVRVLRGLTGRGNGGQLLPNAPSLGQFSPGHKIRYLSAIDILRDLEPAMIEWLDAHTTMITARRGQLIYTPGETSEALFLLKSGRVRTYRLTVDGKKLVLSTIEPRTLFDVI